MKKKQHRRSDCPINFALETFGDRWSLLIIRDIVYFGKKTYGEFLDSDEGQEVILYYAASPLTSIIIFSPSAFLTISKPRPNSSSGSR